MRVSRLLLLVLAAGVLAAMSATSVGSAVKPQKKPKADCARVEFVAGLEAVFGRFKTHAAAITYRNKIGSLGFVNGNIIEGCDGFRVVIRGLDSFDQGVDLQSEAARVNLKVTLECIQAKDDVGELEVVFGHRSTRADAQVLVSRAAALGFVGLELESDPCGGWEIMAKGFTGRAQAQDFVAEAKSVGFDAVIERS